MDKEKYFDTAVEYLGDAVEDSQMARAIIKEAINEVAYTTENIKPGDVVKVLEEWEEYTPDPIAWGGDAVDWYTKYKWDILKMNIAQFAYDYPDDAAEVIRGFTDGKIKMTVWAYQITAGALAMELAEIRE